MEEDETVRVRMSADTAELTAALDDLSARANQFGSALTGALKGAVSGGKSLDQVMRGLGQRISNIALDAALEPLENLFSTAIGGMLGGAGATVTPFAKGGVVAKPSFFSNGSGLGLMGEAGAEAIMPLRRGPDGRLGVAVSGQAANGPSIVFNVSTPDAQSFRKSEMQINAMLARATGRGRRGL